MLRIVLGIAEPELVVFLDIDRAGIGRDKLPGFAKDAFKKMYLNATDADITLIKSPVGLPGRAIRNVFSDSLADGPPKGQRCLANCIKSCSYRSGKIGFCITAALVAAQNGDVEGGLVFSGVNAARCQGGSLPGEFLPGDRHMVVSQTQLRNEI